MNSPIRPLPIEAASQRTENDAIVAGNPGGFEELLDSQYSQYSQSDATGNETQSGEKPPNPAVDPWTILGIAPVVLVPPPIIEPSEVSLSASPDVPPDAERPLVLLPPAVKENSVTSAALLKQLSPIPTTEQELPAVPAPKPVEIAGKPLPTAGKDDGIPVARQTAMLLKMEKSAEGRSNEPQTVSLPVQEFSPPTLTAFSQRSVKWSEPVRPQNIEGVTPQPVLNIEGRSDVKPLAELAPAPELPRISLLESVRDHVRILRVSPQNELQVVLRPDANTELYLHLRRDGGQVHLHARCERGDFAWLDSQWSSIQQSLSTQGVRVEPLESAFRAQNGFPGSNGGSQGSRQESRRPEPFGEFEISKPVKTEAQPGAVRPRGRGWQTWA